MPNGKITLIMISLILPTIVQASDAKKMRPMSYGDAVDLIAAAMDSTFTNAYANTKNEKAKVAWQFITGNHCAERMKFTNFAFSTGKKHTHLPLDQKEMMPLARAVLDIPAFDTASITLLAPMKNLQQTLKTGNRMINKEMGWMNHTASIVNINGKMMVVDITASRKPLEINDWINLYFKEEGEIQCPELNKADYRETLLYLIRLNGGNMPGGSRHTLPKPKYFCGYSIKSWPVEQLDLSYTDKLKETVSSLSSSIHGLSQDVNGLSGLFPGTSFNEIESKVEVASLSKYCSLPQNLSMPEILCVHSGYFDMAVMKDICSWPAPAGCLDTCEYLSLCK